MSRLTLSQTTVAPKRLLRFRTSMLMRVLRSHGRRSIAAIRRSTRYFSSKRDQRQQGEQRGDGEGGRELVFVVEDLDVQRHGVGLAADVAGDHRSPRRTRPSPARCRGSRRRAAPHFMFGSVTRQKICQPLAPSTRAASSSSVPCACISGISSRATKGKVTKTVASTMPGTAKMILMSCVAQPRAEPALQRRTAARRSGRRSPARPRTAGRSASAARSCRGSRTWRSPRRRRRRTRG